MFRLADTVTKSQEHTPSSINLRIRNKTLKNLKEYEGGSYSNISNRIQKLNREWDVERTLETNASVFLLLSTVLGLIHSRRWFYVTGTVAWFLFQHAFQGWCPPLSLFRRLGVRTSGEISEERIALKVLRGDFTETKDAATALYQAGK